MNHDGLSPAPERDGPDNLAYFVTAGTAVIALAFCLVLIVLLIVNAVHARVHDPLAASRIELLRAQLSAQPGNDQLRAEIRALDYNLRSAYFTARARAIQGTYLLALGIAVFLVSSHLAASLRATAPLPKPEAAGRSWADAALSLRFMVALGIVMAGFLLALLMLARHDTSAEYIRAAKQTPAPAEPGQVASVPDPSPETRALPSPALPAPPAPAPPPPLQGSVRRPKTGGPVPPPPTPSQARSAARRNEDGGAVGPVSTATGEPGLVAETTRGWPVFRGQGAGYTQGADFPTNWDVATGEGIVWATDIPLPGHSSPIFCEGRVFVTGADETRREVYAVEATTGKIAWAQVFSPQAGSGSWPPKVSKETGYAAPTMAADGKRVFAIFPNGDVGAWDLAGNLVWAKALGMPQSVYGYAASLAIHNDRVIVQFDQGSSAEEKLSALIALDAATGKQVWRTPRPVRNSWSSPIVVVTPSGAQVITAADPYVIGYDPTTGKEVWRAKCLRGDGGPSPCYADGLAYVCSDLAGLFAIQTVNRNGKKPGDVVWSADEGLPDISSPATNGELVFLAAGYGVITCYDAKTGAKVWEQDLKATFESSPVIVGGHVYVTDMDGVTHIFEAGRKYKVVGQGKVGEAVSATPAFVEGRIYLRSEKRLYCIGPRPTGS